MNPAVLAWGASGYRPVAPGVCTFVERPKVGAANRVRRPGVAQEDQERINEDGTIGFGRSGVNDRDRAACGMDKGPTCRGRNMLPESRRAMQCGNAGDPCRSPSRVAAIRASSGARNLRASTHPLPSQSHRASFAICTTAIRWRACFVLANRSACWAVSSDGNEGSGCDFWPTLIRFRTHDIS